MKAVGVKNLKSRLSEYLRFVKAGETVLVTEHDEVIAELRPAHRQGVSHGSCEEVLNDLADDGRVTLRASEPSHWEGPRSGLSVESKSIDTVLDELRDEGRKR